MAVLEQLWIRSMTVAELATVTSLSRTAVDGVLGDLLSCGWVTAQAPSKRNGTMGRPAAIYSLAPDCGCLAGVDIGAHHVSAEVCRVDGEILAKLRITVTEELPAADRISEATRVFDQALGLAGINPDELWAVCIGSPGVIDNGTVVHFGGSGMPDWIGVDLVAPFAEITSATVFVEGDSALGAVAEMSKGCAGEATDFVYLLSGARTGAALVVHSELHRGHRGGSGLVGELPQLRWRELEHEEYGASVLPQPRPSREEIFALAEAGDPAATAALSDFGLALAEGAAAMVLAVNPELLVIGGPNAQRADLFLESFSSRLAELCPLMPEIKVSALGSDAVLVGTITLALGALRRGLWAAIDSRNSFPMARPALREVPL